MKGISGADDISKGYRGFDCYKKNRKSLLYSSVRIGFFRQTRAGLATGYYTLGLDFVVFSA